MALSCICRRVYIQSNEAGNGFAGAPGRSTAAFPQPRSLSAALLEMQLLVLGPLTAAVSETNQLQILGVGLPAGLSACPASLALPTECWLLAILHAMSLCFRAAQNALITS